MCPRGGDNALYFDQPVIKFSAATIQENSFPETNVNSWNNISHCLNAFTGLTAQSRDDRPQKGGKY